MTMTVKALQESLESLPEDAEVWVAVDNKQGGVDVFLSVEDSFGVLDEDESEIQHVTLFATE